MATLYKKEIMITINNVYKTVLSIINKEQRGFLPPNQFNKIAKQAQLDLLDKSFYEYNRFLNNKKTKRVNSGYADIPQKIKEKIDVFYKIATKTIGSSQITLDTDIYKIINILSSDTLLEEINPVELPYIKSSPLTNPTTDFPAYYSNSTDSTGATKINILPTSLTGNLDIHYIKTPTAPEWKFTYDNSTEQYEYSGGSIDFELHPSEEVDLIIKILAYAGVVIKDPTIIKSASDNEVLNINKENA